MSPSGGRPEDRTRISAGCGRFVSEKGGIRATSPTDKCHGAFLTHLTAIINDLLPYSILSSGTSPKERVMSAVLESTEASRPPFSSESSETVASLNTVTKRYGNGVVALDKLSFTLRRGEVVALLGPNG